MQRLSGPGRAGGIEWMGADRYGPAELTVFVTSRLVIAMSVSQRLLVTNLLADEDAYEYTGGWGWDPE